MDFTSDEILSLVETLRWPFAVVALGAILIFVTRKPLRVLIPRVKRAGRKGLEFEPREQSVEAPTGIEAAQKLMHSWDNQLLVEQEAVVRAFFEQSGITDFDEREKLLIRITAAATIQTMMEQIYNEILGSQINALRTANQHVAGAARAALEPHLTAAKTTWGDAMSDFTFEAWVSYLQGRLLVVEDDGQWKVTVRGREFLKYLVDTQKPNKPF